MSIFYVFQGVPYGKEKSGGYVWSPQFTRNNQRHAGFSNMTKIKKGDFILHNQRGRVVAISVALNDCEEAEQPGELIEIQAENKEGYKVNLTYYPFDIELETSHLREWLIDNYRKDSAFTIRGRGKQQYMCTLANEHALYILERVKEKQISNELIRVIEQAITSITDQKKVSDIESLYRYTSKISTEFGGKQLSLITKENFKYKNTCEVDEYNSLMKNSTFKIISDTKMLSNLKVVNSVVLDSGQQLIVNDTPLFYFDIADVDQNEFEKTNLFRNYDSYRIMFTFFEISKEFLTMNDKFTGLQIFPLREILNKDDIKRFWLNIKSIEHADKTPGELVFGDESMKLVKENSGMVITLSQESLINSLLSKKNKKGMMNIKEIVINQYKALKNIKIEFSDNNLHVLIGNNGTNKTTLFEIIKEAFNKEEKMGDYTVAFEEYGIPKKFISRESDNLNRDVKIFSYALVDRTSNATYVSSIRTFSTYLIEYVLSGKSNLKFILDKIGINKNDFYIEFTNYTIVKRKVNVEKNKLERIEELITTLDSRISVNNLDLILNELKCRSENSEGKQVNIEDFYLQIFNKLIVSQNAKNHSRPNNIVIAMKDIAKNKKDFLNFIELTTLIGFVNPIREIWSMTNENSYPLSELSTGEFSYLYRMLSINSETRDGTIVLIDEPEVHLHPKWIVSYLSDLRRVLKNKEVFIIIATHSPLIINNINNDQLINFYKDNKGKVSVKVEKNNQLFANNTDKILEEYFYVRGNDSEIIQKHFQNISLLIESKEYPEAKKMLKELPMTIEKMKFIELYYDEIQSKEFSNEY